MQGGGLTWIAPSIHCLNTLEIRWLVVKQGKFKSAAEFGIPLGGRKAGDKLIDILVLEEVAAGNFRPIWKALIHTIIVNWFRFCNLSFWTVTPLFFENIIHIWGLAERIQDHIHQSTKSDAEQGTEEGHALSNSGSSSRGDKQHGNYQGETRRPPVTTPGGGGTHSRGATSRRQG